MPSHYLLCAEKIGPLVLRSLRWADEGCSRLSVQLLIILLFIFSTMRITDFFLFVPEGIGLPWIVL